MIDIFLSSPSDVDDERRFIVEAAREWNSVRGSAEGVFLNILTWEDVVAPSLSDRPQAVINEQIGDEYDVYLGVMWGKLGSPTGEADSGTVEEFERALERYRHGDGVRLAMLFKTADIPLAQLDGAQFDKVKEFKRRFAEEGGMYSEFADDDRLRKILNRLFEDIAQTHGGPETEPPAGKGRPRPPKRKRRAPSRPTSDRDTEPTKGNGELATVELRRPADEADELGLFEINDRLTDVSAKQVAFFESLTKEQNEMNAVVEKSAEEMSSLVSFGKADSAQIRASVSRVSKALANFSDFLERNLSSFKSRNDELIDLTERGLDVSTDFGAENSSAIDLRRVVSEVAGTMDQNKSQIETLISALTQLPRLSSEFNKARKRVVEQYRQFKEEIDRLQAAMKAAVTSYPL